MTGAPLATLCETADAWYALGTEVVAGAGALFVRDRRCPDVYDANHARRVPGASDPPAFLAALEEHYGPCSHRAVRLDPRSSGDALEAELLLRGFVCELQILMALEGTPRGRRADVRIRAATGDADWEAVARLKQAEFDADGLNLPGTTWRDHLRRKCPPAITWLAALGGETVGLFSELARGSVALLEDLYVLPAARRRGVATALVAHSTLDAQRRGAGTCFLAARADDTPKEMYARMGFRALGVTRNLLKTGVAGDPAAPR
jgi:GNAT superfamily N-acetyltransferase